MGHGDEDLVTGTPIINEPKAIQDIPIWFDKNIEIFKIVQRVLMIILTIGVLIVLSYVGKEIRDLKTEMKNIAVITEKAMDIAETTRQDINRQIEEIQKDGFKLHFRF